jgi:hypothetical protein
MSPVRPPLLLAVMLVLAGAGDARGDSGRISDVGRASGEQVRARYTATSTTCTQAGGCGWFPYAVQVRGAEACAASTLRLTFVGDFRRRPGTQTGVDAFRPAWPSVRICLYIRGAAGANTLVAQSVWPEGTAEPAPSEPPRPRRPQPLTVQEARDAVSTILRRRFGARFEQRRGYVRRCARVSPARVRCRVRWTSGPWRYAGVVTMRLDREDPDGAIAFRDTVRRTRARER